MTLDLKKQNIQNEVHLSWSQASGVSNQDKTKKKEKRGEGRGREEGRGEGEGKKKIKRRRRFSLIHTLRARRLN